MVVEGKRRVLTAQRAIDRVLWSDSLKTLSPSFVRTEM